MTDKRNFRKRSANARKTSKAKRMSVAGAANTSEVNEDSTASECGLGALLEARDAKLVTLVAGEMQLAVHRSVLEARSTVFATMLSNDMIDVNSIAITDVEPNVLQQLVDFMYKDTAPQLCSMASQLLVAANTYGVLDLKAKCELQLALNLSIENVVTSAIFARCQSCPRLGKTAKCLFQANPNVVMGTEGWAVAVRNSPEEFVEVTRLLAKTPAKLKSRDTSQEEMNRQLLEAVENYRLEEVRKLLATGWSVGARDASGKTVLHYASDTKTTECLLVAGAHVNARDKCHRTPLHAAVQKRSVGMAQCLVKASADVNAADVYGNTPLHLAAELGFDAMVKTLLDVGADKEARNCFMETPLDVAKRCNQKCVSALLSVSGSANLPEGDENPESSLCVLGSDLDATNATLITLVAGETQLAVHRAVLEARSPVFAAMLAHDTVEASSGQIVIPDVEPDVLRQLVLFMYRDRTPEFCTVAPQLLVAADKYYMPDLKEQCELQLVQDLSVDNIMENSLLAVRHSCPHLKKAARCFLQANLTSVVDTEGWAKAVTDNPEEFLEVCRLLATTPSITRTAVEDELDKKLLRESGAFSDGIKKLLGLGAYVGARDESGRTALHISAGCGASGNIKLKLLLAAGADVGARDIDGRTALHYAAASGREEETKCLLQAGACVNAMDRWLQRPLHAAIQKGNVGAVLQLLASRVYVNAPDVYGNTALHLAAQLGNENVFLALLSAGADKHATNDLQETPLDVAKRYNMNSLIDKDLPVQCHHHREREIEEWKDKEFSAAYEMDLYILNQSGDDDDHDDILQWWSRHERALPGLPAVGRCIYISRQQARLLNGVSVKQTYC